MPRSFVLFTCLLVAACSNPNRETAPRTSKLEFAGWLSLEIWRARGPELDGVALLSAAQIPSDEIRWSVPALEWHDTGALLEGLRQAIDQGRAEDVDLSTDETRCFAFRFAGRDVALVFVCAVDDEPSVLFSDRTVFTMDTLPGLLKREFADPYAEFR